MGQDGTVLFLRHGARYIKAHICRVQLTSPLKSEHSETQDKQVRAENSQNNTKNNTVNKIESSSDEEDDHESNLQMHDTAIGNRKNHPHPTVGMKPNQIIKFRDSKDIECIGRVISRAGKATGKYKSCYNIEYQSPLTLNSTKKWIDINSVHDIEVINSSTENNKHNRTSNENEIIEEHQKNEIEEIYINNHLCYEEAKLKEPECWKDNNVYETVENHNQKCISVRWVCSVKQTDKGSKPKALLVARGFEEDDLNTFEKKSPIAPKYTSRTLLSTIIINNWNLKSIDIKTAFLQGEFLKRDVYLKPPPEAHCDNN